MSDNITEPAESTETEQAAEGEEQEQVESQEDEATDDPGNDFDRGRALEKIKKLNSENRNERKKRQDAEEQAKQAEGKDEQVKALEAVNTRYETLGNNDLPIRLAKWISATEPEAILEQAEELLSLGKGAGQGPPSDAPREKSQRVRNQQAQGDEIGNLDDFAKSIYSQ